MYHKVEYLSENNFVPFEIRCTNCGSHNVEVFAYEYKDLGIICRILIEGEQGKVK